MCRFLSVGRPLSRRSPCRYCRHPWPDLPWTPGSDHTVVTATIEVLTCDQHQMGDPHQMGNGHRMGEEDRLGEKTGIEWTDHTFNPWIGCTRVSDACDNCYAATMSQRRKWARFEPTRTATPNYCRLLATAKWNRRAKGSGSREKSLRTEPRRSVRCGSVPTVGGDQCVRA
ncbi:DUF5131 family protein [Reyranella sp.]|uniref:DUF5131 family protein n=1 Tax=Reyranella sp. TaxID=1929291 RepID=UPI0037849291